MEFFFLHDEAGNGKWAVATGPVFAAWDGVDRGPLAEGPASVIAEQGGNDLEAAAISLCSPVAEVLEEVRGSGADLVRMSGSGASCFALFRSHDVMRKAAETLALRRPAWWMMEGNLR